MKCPSFSLSADDGGLVFWGWDDDDVDGVRIVLGVLVSAATAGWKQ